MMKKQRTEWMRKAVDGANELLAAYCGKKKVAPSRMGGPNYSSGITGLPRGPHLFSGILSLQLLWHATLRSSINNRIQCKNIHVNNVNHRTIHVNHMNHVTVRSLANIVMIILDFFDVIAFLNIVCFLFFSIWTFFLVREMV